MPPKTKSALPKYTIEKPSAATGAKAKIVLPKMSVADAVNTVKQLLEQAVEENDGKFVRGTLTLY